MQITFKLYAGLQKYLPPEAQGHAVELTVEDKATIQSLIDRFQISEKEAYLVMLNGVYIPPENRQQRLQNNDVLAIWPKVAGG
jgi:molybdopterin converting factor small subunit